MLRCSDNELKVRIANLEKELAINDKNNESFISILQEKARLEAQLSSTHENTVNGVST